MPLPLKPLLLLLGCALLFMLPVQAANGTVQESQLLRKWQLDHYSYWFFTEAPEAKEENDYLHLKAEGLYSSVSEGAYEAGTWRFDAEKERIYLYRKGDPTPLVLAIESLDKDELVVHIEDSKDPEAAELSIHFKAQT